MLNCGRTILSVLTCIIATTSIGAQTQIPNGDLEDWMLISGTGNFRNYEEPTGGWSSGNGAIHIAMNTDPLTTKVTDAVSGMYAAKLTSGKIFNLLASGSLFTGTFSLNISNPESSAKRGIPFTDRPLRFKGWYKYQSVDGDSGTLYATLSKWDGSKRVVIGEARRMQYTSLENWTEFDLEFAYLSGDTPDTIAVVFASSANGANLVGSVGSTMYVDNLSLVYSPTNVNDADVTSPLATFYATTNTLNVNASSLVSIVVVDACGNSVMKTHAMHSIINMDVLASGVYGVCIVNTDGSVQRMLCTIAH